MSGTLISKCQSQKLSIHLQACLMAVVRTRNISNCCNRFSCLREEEGVDYLRGKSWPLTAKNKTSIRGPKKLYRNYQGTDKGMSRRFPKFSISCKLNSKYYGDFAGNFVLTTRSLSTITLINQVKISLTFFLHSTIDTRGMRFYHEFVTAHFVSRKETDCGW